MRRAALAVGALGALFYSFDAWIRADLASVEVSMIALQCESAEAEERQMQAWVADPKSELREYAERDLPALQQERCIFYRGAGLTRDEGRALLGAKEAELARLRRRSPLDFFRVATNKRD